MFLMFVRSLYIKRIRKIIYLNEADVLTTEKHLRTMIDQFNFFSTELMTSHHPDNKNKRKTFSGIRNTFDNCSISSVKVSIDSCDKKHIDLLPDSCSLELTMDMLSGGIIDGISPPSYLSSRHGIIIFFPLDVILASDLY